MDNDSALYYAEQILNNGGCLTLSLDSMPSDVAEGIYTLTVYFTVNGTGYKVTGTTELIDELSKGKTAINSASTYYISSKKGSIIEETRIKYCFSQEDEICTSVLLVPSGTNDGIKSNVTLPNDIAEGYYDVLITTSTGRNTRNKN